MVNVNVARTDHNNYITLWKLLERTPFQFSFTKIFLVNNDDHSLKILFIICVVINRKQLRTTFTALQKNRGPLQFH